MCISDFGVCTHTVANQTSPALPQSFTVPIATALGEPVKELVIEFISGDCVGTARATELLIFGTLGAPQVAGTGDNFTVNKIPMAVAQFNDTLNVNAVQAFAQATKVTYAPRTMISLGFDRAKGGATACRVQFNGHFVTR